MRHLFSVIVLILLFDNTVTAESNQHSYRCGDPIIKWKTFKHLVKDHPDVRIVLRVTRRFDLGSGLMCQQYDVAEGPIESLRPTQNCYDGQTSQPIGPTDLVMTDRWHHEIKWPFASGSAPAEQYTRYHAACWTALERKVVAAAGPMPEDAGADSGRARALGVSVSRSSAAERPPCSAGHLAVCDPD